MADTGYFDSVSANLKTGVGAQVKGISEGVKANSDAGVSPSVNALDTGVKAAAAIGGLADGSARVFSHDANVFLDPLFRIGSLSAENDPWYVPDWRAWRR